VSKGSPFSASTLNLSLYYQACCSDQYLDHSCSSYIRWSFRALNLILDIEDFSSAQNNLCCLCRIGPNQAKVIKKNELLPIKNVASLLTSVNALSFKKGINHKNTSFSRLFLSHNIHLTQMTDFPTVLYSLTSEIHDN